MKRAWLRISPFFFLLLLIAIACNGNNSTVKPSETDSHTGGVQTDIEIFTWWVNPGEADALQMLVLNYQIAYPDVSVVDLASVFGDSHDAHASVVERIENGNPPEIYQATPAGAEIFVGDGNDNNNTKLQILDELFETEPWGEQFRPEFLEAATAKDGHLYSLPISVIRSNTMFYNKLLVPTPPKTLDELFGICRDLSAKGIIPVAISEESWILGHVLKPMLAASAGFDFFQRFYDDELEFVDDKEVALLEGALRDFVELMKYTNKDGQGMEWQDAADLLYNQEAAFYFHPSWAKGYLTSLGWQAGKDFGMAPMPGTQNIFIYSFDGFVSFTESNNASNGLDFLRIAGSEQSQGDFNKIKGQLPTLEGVNMSQWDDLAIQSYQELDSAEHLYYAERSDAFGLDQYTKTLYGESMSVEEVAQRIIQNYTFARDSK